MSIFYDSQGDFTKKKSKQTQKQSLALLEEITVISYESKVSKQQLVMAERGDEIFCHTCVLFVDTLWLTDFLIIAKCSIPSSQ